MPNSGNYIPKILAILIVTAVTGCSSGGTHEVEALTGDNDLTCAALISAADQLMQNNSVASDPIVLKKGLMSSMSYLNAYAIPKNIKEQQAFSDVKAESAKLISEVSSDQIVARAKACILRMTKG